MAYTPEVERLIADPFGGRSAEDVRALCSGALAQEALGYQVEGGMIDKIAFDMDLTRERAIELVEETKKFLVLGRLVGEQLAPSPAVDDVWHMWILFTKDYHAFCALVGGYIHHKPIPTGSPSQPPLEPTVALLEAAFGPVDREAWPVELGARGIMDCKMGA